MPRTSSVWPLDNPPGVPVDRRSIIGLQTNLHRWRACVRISLDTKDGANVMISWATATCVTLHTGLHRLCPWLTAVLLLVHTMYAPIVDVTVVIGSSVVVMAGRKSCDWFVQCGVHHCWRDGLLSSPWWSVY